MIVLSFDPGKNHWAYSLTELKEGKCINLKHGIIKNVLTSLKGEEFNSQILELKKDFDNIISNINFDIKTDYICAERFMYRPGFGMGAVSEFINLQLGLITAWSKIPMILITASTWKNYMRKTYKLSKNKENILEILKEKDKKICIHEADAISIGLYCLEMDNKEYKEKLLKDVIL